MKIRSYDCIKWILVRLKKYKLMLGLVFSLLFVYVLLQMLLPVLNRELLDNGLIAFNSKYSYKIIVVIFFINIVCLVIQQVKEHIRLRLFRAFKSELSDEAYSHLFHLSYKNIEKRDVTELIMTTETDVDMISLVTDELFVMLLTQCAIFVGAMIGLFCIDYKLAFIIVLYTPLKFFISIKLSNKNLEYTKEKNCLDQKYLGWFGNIASGLKEVRLFNQISAVQSECSSKSKKRIGLLAKKSLLNSWKSTINGFFNDLLIFLIYFIGITFALTFHTLSIGSIIAFVSYTQKVIQPINFILDSRFVFSNILPSVNRHINFLKLDEERDYLGKQQIEPITQIDFRNVSFSYDGNKKVLDNVSFSIKSGDKVALIGNNGAGKSTIIDLLLGLYNVTNGGIFINSFNLCDISLLTYRQHIAVVSQNIYVFNDTIENNITLGQKVDRDKLNHILDMCALTEFVEKVGFDYNTGVAGSRLSGGQRQKIALARALLRDADVFIFDEVTSNIDQDSCHVVNALIKNELKGKIVLASTHDQGLISGMDKAVYLVNGKIESQKDI